MAVKTGSLHSFTAESMDKQLPFKKKLCVVCVAGTSLECSLDAARIHDAHGQGTALFAHF